MNHTQKLERDLFLDRQALLYDLPDMQEREESTRRLNAFYIDIQRSLGTEICFEVGAGLRERVLEMHEALPDARIIAFEGNPLVPGPLKNREESSDEAVRYIRKALGETREAESYFICRKNADGTFGMDPFAEFDPEKAREAKLAIDRKITSYGLALWLRDCGDKKFSIRIHTYKGLYRIMRGGENMTTRAESLMLDIPREGVLKSKQWTPYDLVTYLEEAGFDPVARDFPSESAPSFRMVFVKGGARRPEIKRDVETFLTRDQAVEPEPELPAKKPKFLEKLKG